MAVAVTTGQLFAFVFAVLRGWPCSRDKFCTSVGCYIPLRQLVRSSVRFVRVSGTVPLIRFRLWMCTGTTPIYYLPNNIKPNINHYYFFFHKYLKRINFLLFFFQINSKKLYSIGRRRFFVRVFKNPFTHTQTHTMSVDEGNNVYTRLQVHNNVVQPLLTGK